MKIQLKTDPGRVRTANQDAMTVLTLEKDALFAAVCDGMGGANGGNVASDLCVRTLEQYVRTHYDAEMDEAAIYQLLTDALREANRLIHHRAKEDPKLTGMGTTAVLAVVRPGILILANVGDSRAILYRNAALTQLTKDHSYVQAMVDSGRITEKQAQTHPQKHIITRAVGVHIDVDIDLFTQSFQADDLLLLCSDGLTNELDYEELLQLIQTHPIEGLAETLVDQANEKGGHDNCTVVLVKV